MIEEKDIPTKYGQVIPKSQDTYESYINGIPMATHFYYIDTDLMFKSGKKCLKPITQSGFVMNFLYMPFLERQDVDLWEIDYDQKNLGSVSDTSTDPEEGVKVYKIINGKINDKEIGTVNIYPKFERERLRSPKNESKLYQYPYHYITINDYINQPLQINPQYIEGVRNTIDVKVSQPISITGGYTIYIDGYKGDKNQGANEGLFSSAGLDLPTSGTQYAQFMANSKNSFLQENIAIGNNYRTATATNIIGGVSSGNAQTMVSAGKEAYKGYKDYKGSLLASMGGGAALGSVAGPIGTAVGAGVGLVGGLVSGHINNKNNKENAIQSAIATINDTLSAPRNVSLSSSDILMTLDRNKGEIVYNRYWITKQYQKKIADYWTLYGYKQNKMMKNPDNKLITSRKYFNYIKTIDANIYGENLDKSEVELIKDIYNSGITFWHQEQLHKDGLQMFDYHIDNKERWDV